MSHCLPFPPPKPAAPTFQIAASLKQTQLITSSSFAVGTPCFSRTAVMPNESTKQKMYDTLRGQVSARLIRAMDIAEVDIANLSLGELINTLFLMHGDGGSTGNFSVSFGAALTMVGAELMWQEPAANKVAIVEPAELVQ